MGLLLTKHQEWLDTFYHVCDEDKPCGDVLACKYCRYRQENRMSEPYWKYLPEDGNFTEEELWEAIAESKGIDVNEIMDGDLAEWL